MHPKVKIVTSIMLMVGAVFLLTQQSLGSSEADVDDGSQSVAGGFQLPESAQDHQADSLLFGVGSTLATNWPLTITLFGVLLAIVLTRRRFWLSQIAVVLFAFVIEQVAEFWHHEQRSMEHRIETTSSLGAIRSNLENVLAKFLAEVSAVSAFVTLKPDLDQVDFNAFVRVIMAREPAIAAVAAAPDLVIRFVHPLDQNRGAVGYDYRADADKFAAVNRAIESGDFSLEGPMQMDSGLDVFFARAPVYIPSADGRRRLWGVISAPIDLHGLYRKAGLAALVPGLRVAIRRLDSADNGDAPFYGEAAIFADPHAVTMPVLTGAQPWEIGAVMTETVLEQQDLRLLLIRASGVFLAALLMMSLSFRRLQSQNREALEHARQRNAAFMHGVESVAQVGGWRLGDNCCFSDISPQARRMVGIAPDTADLQLQDFVDLFVEDQRDELSNAIASARANRSDFDIEIPLERDSGVLVWLRIIGDPIGDEQELIGAVQDITERKQADELIEFQANFDSLTGLPNRLLFRDRLESAITKAIRSGNRLAVLFIDLDNFKSVNDNLGHSAGDKVLCETARRIRSCVRDSDSVARHSGDEFTVILQEMFTESAIYKIVENMVEAIGRPFVLGGSQVFCGASIGVALYPDDAADADTLLINADQAMYEVKKSGRNGWHFYTDEMQRKSEYRHRLYNDLVAALNDAKLTVHYQPIVSIETGKTVSCEALARWQTTDGGWISPTEFVSVAEESGLINRIDYLVMKQALAFVTEVNRERDSSLRVSVNVSPRVFISKDASLERWLELVRTAKGEIGVSVEITERLMIDESEKVESIFGQIHSAGLGITIDDFGTGYSSLGYLARFPVNMLKIDRSFISAIGRSKPEETLIETIILLSGQLGIEAVAEGIETEEQMEFLRCKGCDFAQGYHVGRPMDEQGFRQFLMDEDQRAGA